MDVHVSAGHCVFSIPIRHGGDVVAPGAMPRGEALWVGPQAGSLTLPAAGSSTQKRRVVVVTSGSRGDVQPYIAIALELERRGHEAAVATEERMRPLVEGYGVQFKLIAGDPTGLLWAKESQVGCWEDGGAGQMWSIRGTAQDAVMLDIRVALGGATRGRRCVS